MRNQTWIAAWKFVSCLKPCSLNECCFYSLLFSVQFSAWRFLEVDVSFFVIHFFVVITVQKQHETVTSHLWRNDHSCWRNSNSRSLSFRLWDQRMGWRDGNYYQKRVHGEILERWSRKVFMLKIRCPPSLLPFFTFRPFWYSRHPN